MNELFHEAARQVHQALGVLGVSAMHDGADVDMPELHLRVRVIEAVSREAGVFAVYDLGGRDDEGDGIQVLAVGYGDTPEQAFGEAALQWTTGVFTAVRHWLQPGQHTCFAEDFHMLVGNEESGEEFAWRVHMGPMLGRMYGADEEGPEHSTAEVMRTIFDDVRPYAGHGTLFWIEAFAVKYPDGQVDSTCRMRNDDWPEGREALLRWASTWKVPEGATYSLRQFLLFEPIDPAALPNRGALAAEMARLRGTARRPWWKRLFGRP